MSAPCEGHLIAAKRILRYVSGTLNLGIFFQHGPLSLSAFSDLDWVGDPYDRWSTTGFLVYLSLNPITWSAKKQDTVSCCSTESEYRALATTAAKLVWIRQVLKDLGIFLSFAPKLWCDNVSTLAIASNPVFHARTKHVEVDYHFVCVRGCFAEIFRFVMWPLVTSLLTFFRRVSLPLVFSGYVPNPWCLLTPWFWGGMKVELQKLKKQNSQRLKK